MNKLHLLVIVTGLGLLLGVTPSWGQTPVCVPPGCNSTQSDGNGNTAGGTDADSNPTKGEYGMDNTAFGDSALYSNLGSYNTASGFQALYQNVGGLFNTANGFGALYFNNTGSYNTASGAEALYGENHGSDTSGSDNTANGVQALYSNTSGGDNTASGYGALLLNSSGNQNTAVGADALENNGTGGNNIAIGFNAGMNLTTGSNNIDIGDNGVTGESDTTRIGTNGMQSKVFIAGVSGKNVKGAEVVISSTGQLGVVKSSARYKRDIHDMGDASSKLMRLRPVTLRYKEDPAGTIQYGLVAEEVARIYPELVIYGEDGKVETVRYSELTGMLLNELQKQRSENARQAAQIKKVSAQMSEVKVSFERRLSALEQTTQARNADRKLAAAFDR
jgi:hypothetical protein